MSEIIPGRLTDYNRISRPCAQQCDRIRQCLSAGISPGNVVAEACAAAGIHYGGCPSKTGPEEGRCMLPSDTGRAVDVYSAGVAAALMRASGSAALREMQTVATGTV